MKKLIPAICLLLVSAVMLGTSTFAWFSMNTSVTATGMQIAAKSNNTYLLINTGDNDTAAEIQTAGVTTIALTVSDVNAKVYPSKPKTPAEVDTDALFDGDTAAYAGPNAAADHTNAAAYGNWYTAQNNNPAASTDSVKNATSLTGFTNYVITKTLYLTVAAGANPAENLTVTPTIALKEYEKTTDVAIDPGKTYYTESAGVYSEVDTPVVGDIGTYYEALAGTAITAVKVLITTSNGGSAILSSANNGTPVDIKGSNTPLTDSTVLTVNIYIYYDGSDSSVYTNNIANLGAATIDLAFDVDAIA